MTAFWTIGMISMTTEPYTTVWRTKTAARNKITCQERCSRISSNCADEEMLISSLLRSSRAAKTTKVANKAMIAYRIVLFSTIMDDETVKTTTGSVCVAVLLIKESNIVLCRPPLRSMSCERYCRNIIKIGVRAGCDLVN
jgi:hypothetical protein